MGSGFADDVRRSVKDRSELGISQRAAVHPAGRLSPAWHPWHPRAERKHPGVDCPIDRRSDGSQSAADCLLGSSPIIGSHLTDELGEHLAGDVSQCRRLTVPLEQFQCSEIIGPRLWPQSFQVPFVEQVDEVTKGERAITAR